MRLEIVAPQDHSSSIIADLTRRRGEMERIDIRGDNKASVNPCYVSISAAQLAA